jgi:nucleoside-diphosphate-sugar epimerase
VLDSAASTDTEAVAVAASLLEGATHLVVTAAPDPKLGDPVLHVLGTALRALPAGQIVWVGYLSTTGVYGNCEGDLVTEDTPCKPSSQRGTLRVDAERAWEALGLPLHVFRLPGIYGPHRGPLAKLRDGTTRHLVLKPGHYFNRIHVDDIVQVPAPSHSPFSCGFMAPISL